MKKTSIDTPAYLGGSEQASESENGNRHGCEIGAFVKDPHPRCGSSTPSTTVPKESLMTLLSSSHTMRWYKARNEATWNRSCRNIHAPRQRSCRNDHTPSTEHSQWKSRSSSPGAQKKGLPACDCVPTHSCRVCGGSGPRTTSLGNQCQGARNVSPPSRCWLCLDLSVEDARAHVMCWHRLTKICWHAPSMPPTDP